MRRYLASTKGTISIMIILVVVVLSSLGAIALVVSSANSNLADKANAKVENYYYADSQAENMIMEIDSYLFKASVEAGDYIKDSYINRILPEELLNIAYQTFRDDLVYYHKNKTLMSMHINNIYKRFYYYYAYTMLMENPNNLPITVHLSYEYKDERDLLNSNLPVPNNNTIKIYYSTFGNDNKTTLDIILGVSNDYFITDYNIVDDWIADISMKPYNAFNRYTILQFKQRQSIVYDEDITG